MFLYGEDRSALAEFLRPYGIDALPWLNRTERTDLALTARQRRRIEALYAQDFALIGSLRMSRRLVMGPEPWSEAIRIAAE